MQFGCEGLLRKHYIMLTAAYVFFVAYIVWQYWSYKQQGWDFVSWHLHLAPYVFLLLLWFFVRQRRLQTTNGLLAVLSIIVTLLAIELVLTFALGSKPLYYKFKCDARNYYHTWPANHTHDLITSEFNYQRYTNRAGFADKEWNIDKRGKKRIIALGDSFTEGDGAPADSSFPVLLQQLLNTDSTQWEVLNAGTCGSDPVFDYEKLNGLLLAYKPDVVLQTISTRDFESDIAKRGGFERFKADSTIEYRPLPWWFYPAAISNIIWLAAEAVEYSGYTLKEDNQQQMVKQTEQQIVNRYMALAKRNKFKMVFVMLPYKPEVSDGKYRYDFSSLKKNVRGHAKVIDLLPSYQRWLVKGKKKISDFYWAHDAHHNAAGYHMMAACIAQYLQKK